MTFQWAWKDKQDFNKGTVWWARERRAFQAEGTAQAKAWRSDVAWCAREWWTERCTQEHLKPSPMVKSYVSWDFPVVAVVKNPSANAGDTGSSPGLRRSHMPRSNWAHAPQLLSPRATTTEARMPRALLHNKRSHRNEKPVHRNKEKPPLTATRESPHAAMKTQRSQKLIN